VRCYGIPLCPVPTKSYEIAYRAHRTLQACSYTEQTSAQVIKAELSERPTNFVGSVSCRILGEMHESNYGNV